MTTIKNIDRTVERIMSFISLQYNSKSCLKKQNQRSLIDFLEISMKWNKFGLQKFSAQSVLIAC